MPGLTNEQKAYMIAHQSDNLQPNLIASLVLTLFFAWLSVILRLICRRLRRAPLLLDDWLIIVALIIITGHRSSLGVAIWAGMGRHILFARDVQLEVKCSYAGQTLYSLTTFFTKISILALYRRIMPTKWMKVGSWIITALVVGYSGALIGVNFSRCIPLEKLWNREIEGWCMNTFVPFLTLAIANVITDVAILILPIRPVSQLNMDRTRKLSVLGVFAMGGVVCIFGIIRCWAVTRAGSVDVTYSNVQGGIWSDVEATVGLVCASLPTYRPLYSHAARQSNFPLTNGTSRSQREKKQAYSSMNIPLSNRMGRGGVWTRVGAENDEQPITHKSTDASLEDIPETGIKVKHELHQY